MFSGSKNLKKCNEGIMQLFSADATVFSKNKKYCDPENLKKPP